MAMAATLCSSQRQLSLFFSFFLTFLFLSAHSLYFNMSHFYPHDPILRDGDVTVTDGKIIFSNPNSVGRVVYNNSVYIFDSKTRKLTDFKTHFSFIINTGFFIQDYGHGLAFFLAPVGFQIPTNSLGLYLGLYNNSANSHHNQIVHVEFDTYPNPECDPKDIRHVGINNCSINSSVYTEWNPRIYGGDTIDARITYDSTTKNLSVSWKSQNNHNSRENSSLSYPIDLSKVLPDQVIIGFSSAITSINGLSHTILSWEFNSTLERADGESREKTRNPRFAVLLESAIAIVGAMIGFAILLWRYKTINGQTRESTNLTSINNHIARTVRPRRFSYKQLVLATNNFSDEKKLGQGGFGAVYRGYLPHLEMLVAVKKISRGSRQGKREYETEVKVISCLQHRNLVQLIGCCHEKGEFLLVYEFMPNGSLDSHLFGKKPPLAWSTRQKIALGLASAVLYLHEEWEQCVLHRDIKSSNIMLDSNFNVKLGDFGLAKLMDHELGSQTTRLAGTFGYLAPEYISTHRASKESDVYSFGVVALEIATGRKATDLMEGKDGEKGLIEWVWDHYGREELRMIVDEKLNIDYDEDQIECLMIVGLWCAHPNRNMRPLIRQALQVLNFEATMPSFAPKMPVPIYHVPALSISSEGSLKTTSLHMDR